MIVYDLQCEHGHRFEAWFASSASFDEQKADGKLVCPHCGSSKVEKAVMAPALSGAKKPSLNAGEISRMRKAISEVRKKILESGEDVGKRFPEEARAMHYGDKEMRQIYGQATVEEAVDLVNEGINIAALPPDPEKDKSAN